jgi:D-3-phosphoglycerate dehydrogenase
MALICASSPPARHPPTQQCLRVSWPGQLVVRRPDRSGRSCPNRQIRFDGVLRTFLTHNPEDLEAYYGRVLAELRMVADVVLNPFDRDLTTDELVEHAAGCQVVIAHRATPGEGALFDRNTDVVAFLRTAVDISTIDVGAASRNGVLVACADKSFVPSTAEIALALMLDLARNVSESTIDYRRGGQPSQRPGFQLRGRTAGLIGCGAIGSYLCDALVALGVEVLVADPYTQVSGVGIRQVELTELLAESDFVLPLAASTPETQNLIDADALALMKPGAMLVNVSRGELLDEQAVAAAIDTGRLGGLAMDVGRAPDQRPAPELAARPGVVATPHLGGLTRENADAQAMSSVEQVRAIVAHELPPRAVNADHASRLRAWWAT